MNKQNQRNDGLIAYNGPSCTLDKKPSEPCVMDRAREILRFASQALDSAGEIKAAICGPEPCDVGKNEMPQSLESLLAVACTSVACLCGELATIKNRLTD